MGCLPSCVPHPPSSFRVDAQADLRPSDTSYHSLRARTLTAANDAGLVS